MPPPTEFDVPLDSGTVHCRRVGAQDARLLLCVHGLSANLHGFDAIADALGGPARQVVAFDLRGRGSSPDTGPGTYGLPTHARDCLQLADRLGAASFDLAGWSLGGLIGIWAAAGSPDRVRTLTVIDHADREDDSALEAVRTGLGRLDALVADPGEYLAAIRSAGVATPWDGHWERFYRYELAQSAEGWRPVTSKRAALEDLEFLDRHSVRELWPRLSMPILLVRARIPLGGGFVLPPSERDAFLAAAPGATLVEVDRNHFGVMTDPRVPEAMARLLDSAGRGR